MAQTIDMADWEADYKPILDEHEARNNAQLKDQYERVRKDDERRQSKAKTKKKKNKK